MPVLVIWDSLAITATEREMDDDFNYKQIGVTAAAVTSMSKQLNQVINNSNVGFVILNQARDDFNARTFPGAPTPIKSTGGKALEHWASLRLEVSEGKKLKEKKVSKITGKKSSGTKATDYIGHIFRVKVKKSKVSSRDQQAEMFLLSDPYKGLNHVENIYRSSVSNASDSNNQFGLISGGAWRKYETLDGEEINLRDNDWVPFLESEEGQPVLEELFLKQMVTVFPNWYAPLDNEHVDITKDPKYARLKEYYENKEKPEEDISEEEEQEENTENEGD